MGVVWIEPYTSAIRICSAEIKRIFILLIRIRTYGISDIDSSNAQFVRRIVSTKVDRRRRPTVSPELKPYFAEPS